MTSIVDNLNSTMYNSNSSFRNSKTNNNFNLTFTDLKTLIKEMNFNHLYNENEIFTAFKYIDTEKKGTISKSDFLEYHMNSAKKSLKGNIYDYLSKSEVAISKLKKLRIKCEIRKDIEALGDIDWIMDCIVSNNWDETYIERKEEGNDQDALKQYSNAQELLSKRNDLKSILNPTHKSNKPSTKMKNDNTDFQNNTIEEKNIQDNNNQKKRDRNFDNKK